MKKEIIKMLNAFMANSYLVPSTHTDFLNFTDSDEEYKTYSNDGRDYFTFDIKKGGKTIYHCEASKNYEVWSISGQELLTAKTVKTQLNTAYKYIKLIYDEIHSLNPDNQKIKQIRKLISQKEREVKKIRNEIEILKKEIKDSKILTQKK